MYIHFYTESSDETNKIRMAWYVTQTEDVELFHDIEAVYRLMKKYKLIKSYSGDIIKVSHVNQFQQTMCLLGADATQKQTLITNEGVPIDVYVSESTIDSAKSNDIFEICFAQYDIYASFGNDESPESSKSLIPLEAIITTSKTIQYVTVFNNKPVFSLDQTYTRLQVHKVQTKIPTSVLAEWFSVFINKGEYLTAHKMLSNLIESVTGSENTIVDTSTIEDGQSVCGGSVIGGQSNIEWVQLFCTLYMEPGQDTSLSAVYEDYCTASKWVNWEHLTMQKFIKILRAENKYPIKRRAKGMMVIGYHSLVSQQDKIYKDVKKGNGNGTHELPTYATPVEATNYYNTHKHAIDSIQHPYTREAFFLLRNINIPITEAVVTQFCAIPSIHSQLSKYSEYITTMLSLSMKDDMEASSLGLICDYRILMTNCALYYPFSYKTRTNPIKDSVLLTEQGFQPFDEHCLNYEMVDSEGSDLANCNLEVWNKMPMIDENTETMDFGFRTVWKNMNKEHPLPKKEHELPNNE